MPMTQERYLSVSDVADRLGVSIYTVLNWIKITKRLKAQKIGRQWRITESEL